MIRFNTIDITSFKSIYHITLDFRSLRSNFYTLEGINNVVDFATSNGAGKSTIWDAISFALYNTTIGLFIKKENYQNIHTKIPLKIIIDIDIEKENKTDSYRIERTIKSLQLYKNGENISELTKTETEKKLQTIIEITKEEFFSFTYLTQTTGGNFLTKTPTEKFNILKDFIFGEELNQIKEKLDDLIKTENKNYTDLYAKYNQIEGSIKSLENIILTLNNDTKYKNNTTFGSNNFDNVNIEQEKENLQKLKQQKIELIKKEQEIRNLKKEYNNIVQQLSVLKDKYNSIVVDAICPTCFQHIQKQDNRAVTTISNEAKKLKHTAIEIKEKVNVLLKDFNEKSLQDIDLKISNTEKLIEEYNKFSQIKKLMEKKNEIEESVKTQKEELQSISKKLSEKEAIQNSLKDLKKYFNNTFIQYVQKSFLTEIENYLNLYCYEVFNERFSIVFDKNNIELYIGEHPYSYFSGGERQRIDLIFCFAIKVALLNFTDKCTNLLIFDESLSGSDSLAFDNTVDLINRLSKINNLIVILISHRENSNCSNLGKITISRFEDKTNITVTE